MTERIIDSIRLSKTDTIDWDYFAHQFKEIDTCDCKYFGIINETEYEKKILFRCDSIKTKINGDEKIYGESYLVSFNEDSIIKIDRGVVYFSIEN